MLGGGGWASPVTPVKGNRKDTTALLNLGSIVSRTLTRSPNLTNTVGHQVHPRGNKTLHEHPPAPTAYKRTKPDVEEGNGGRQKELGPDVFDPRSTPGRR